MGAHTKVTTMLGRVQRCDRAGQRFVFAAVLVAPLLHASIACAADATAVHRFYNTRTATHFYTISARNRRRRSQHAFSQSRPLRDGRSRIHGLARTPTINGPAAGIFRRRTPPRGHARDHPFLLPPQGLQSRNL